ncbi:MAG: cytidine deaminase [Candidatus Marinimicrobia bacterium CG1_02_48_14]|nr:MAG: cytidine deaminase [Candidatus Marinimicrobia bacterium CG1_02_48_14]PIZ67647.1 MAG: cytidine deaminase [Candidatus Marinimicrobia bacterium CG_4_10_14_0_2_um_filter_48_9]PJA52096.1 MAG: cytidine deaminase [Candidatus Marinimicrobia bacterium CG_4_9_14_3_um_filter_48_9]
MTNDDDLKKSALNVRKRAYAPYSNFQVGAAIRTENGHIYTGCNVENASFGLTVCAERNALASAIAAGENKFIELMVASNSGVPPCGACRQVIWELCGNIPVRLLDESGNESQTTSRDLLPGAFDKTMLTK